MKYDDTKYFYDPEARVMVNAIEIKGILPQGFKPIPRPITHEFMCCCFVMQETMAVVFEVDVLLNKKPFEIKKADPNKLVRYPRRVLKDDRQVP